MYHPLQQIDFINHINEDPTNIYKTDLKIFSYIDSIKLVFKRKV